MSSKESRNQAFYYRQSCKGNSYNIRNYWCPGDTLKEDDKELLIEVKNFYQKNGYPPCRGDIPQESVCRLKGRFRTWKNVILAAGLPGLNSAEAQMKRKEAAEKKLN